MRDGFRTITPYLIINNALILLDFVKKAFGAEERYRSLSENGRLKHGEVRIGDSMLMLAEAPNTADTRPCHLHLYMENPELHYQRSIDAGATSVMEPTDRMAIGERLAGVQDPTGNIWWIAWPISNRALDEEQKG